MHAGKDVIIPSGSDSAAEAWGTPAHDVQGALQDALLRQALPAGCAFPGGQALALQQRHLVLETACSGTPAHAAAESGNQPV